MHHLTIISHQADELKKQYDKNPTEENKKKWYDKVNEAKPFYKTVKAQIKEHENICRKR